VAYQFTAEDLLAVSMLGIPVVGHYALHVLNYGAAEFSGLLGQMDPAQLRQLVEGVVTTLPDHSTHGGSARNENASACQHLLEPPAVPSPR
jgi:hypothetical protein